MRVAAESAQQSGAGWVGGFNAISQVVGEFEGFADAEVTEHPVTARHSRKYGEDTAAGHRPASRIIPATPIRAPMG